MNIDISGTLLIIQKIEKETIDRISKYQKEFGFGTPSHEASIWGQCRTHIFNLQGLLEIPIDKLTDEMYNDYYEARVFIRSQIYENLDNNR